MLIKLKLHRDVVHDDDDAGGEKIFYANFPQRAKQRPIFGTA